MPLNETSAQAELVEKLGTANIHLVFAWRRTPDDWYAERVPTLGPLTDRLRELATKTATDLHDNRSEVTYHPEYPLNETQFFALSNPRSVAPPSAPIGGNLFPQLDDFGQLPSYGTRKLRSNPNLYVIIAQLDNGSIAKFGRRVTAAHLLKSSRWIRALWSGETLNLLDEGPVLTLDPFIDWTESGDQVVVVDAPGFHTTFRTLPQLRRAVQGNLDIVTGEIAIQNSDEFVARCQATPSMASKLQSIVEQQLYKKPITMLKAYSAKYPKLGVQWAEDSLVFDGSLERQWSILRLLDEAGFTGELSGEQFEAPAKRHL
jgi:hypothetical protein